MKRSTLPHATNLWSSTWLEHGLLTLLLVIGTVRAIVTGAPLVALVPAVVAFLAWYAVGIRLARRATTTTGSGLPTRLSSTASDETKEPLRPSKDPPRTPAAALGWLAGLILLWTALVLVSPSFAWMAFSLWLLIGHFFDLWRGLVLSVAVLLVVLASTGTSGGMSMASVLGPTIGAFFAVLISRGRHQLIRDAIERQALVDSLIRAQAESEELGAELVAAQRESGVLAERTRLARDIHDGLAQNFSSILLTARAARDGQPTEGSTDLAAASSGALQSIEHSALDGLEEARRVVAALAPKGLADTGLTASLSRLLTAVTEHTGLETELHVDGELTSLPTSVEVALLRVAQGGLANVRQHAGASRVVVSLTDAGETVRLDIVDNGKGFDPLRIAAPSDGGEAGASTGGYGLRSSRDRLRGLGGGLDIESRAGGGTALTAYLPLHPSGPGTVP